MMMATHRDVKNFNDYLENLNFRIRHQLLNLLRYVPGTPSSYNTHTVNKFIVVPILIFQNY